MLKLKADGGVDGDYHSSLTTAGTRDGGDYHSVLTAAGGGGGAEYNSVLTSATDVPAYSSLTDAQVSMGHTPLPAY